MSNDLDKLELRIFTDVSQSQKAFDELSKTVERSHKVMERLSTVKDSLKGIDSSANRANVNFRGLTKQLKGVADPFAEVDQQLSKMEQKVAKLKSRIFEKGLVGGSVEKEKGQLEVVSNNLKAYIKAVRSNRYLKEVLTKQETDKLQGGIALEQTKQNVATEFQSRLSQRVAQNTALSQAEQQAQFEWRLKAQEQYMEQLEAEKERKTALLELQRRIWETENATAEARAGLEAFERHLDPAKEKLYELRSRLQEAEDEFVRLRVAGEDTTAIERTIKHLYKEINKLEHNTKKASGWISKLFGRIRNISIYRTIRSGIKWLTSGIQEGIQNFAQFDETANATMSNITASLKQIRNTIGIGFVSVLQALEPTIMAVTNSLVNMLDAFNLAMAKISGETEYYKAKRNVEDYAESLDKAKGSLADFDKFRSLQDDNSTPIEDMFSKEKIDENETRLSQFFEHIIATLQAVGSVVKSVFTSLQEEGIFDMLLDGFVVIAKTIADIVVAVSKFIKILSNAKLLVPILAAMAAGFITVKLAAIGAAIANAAAFMFAHPIAGAAILAGAVATVGTVASMLTGGGSATGMISNIASGSGYNAGSLATSSYTSASQSTISSLAGSSTQTIASTNNNDVANAMAVAVSDGCYRGVIDALSDADSVSSGTTTSASVEIRGETLFTIVKDVAKQKGYKFAKV